MVAAESNFFEQIECPYQNHDITIQFMTFYLQFFFSNWRNLSDHLVYIFWGGELENYKSTKQLEYFDAHSSHN